MQSPSFQTAFGVTDVYGNIMCRICRPSVRSVAETNEQTKSSPNGAQ